MWVSCGEPYFPIHQMKPSQEDWQKLVFKRKKSSVLEKLHALCFIMVQSGTVFQSCTIIQCYTTVQSSNIITLQVPIT